MENGFNKKKRGTWFVILMLLVVPMVGSACTLLGMTAGGLNVHSRLNVAQIHAFGGLIGLVFYVIYWISGGLTRALIITVQRLKEFFEDWFTIGFSIAVGGYRDNVKENGMDFLWYFLAFAAILAYFLYGFLTFLNHYHLSI